GRSNHSRHRIVIIMIVLRFEPLRTPRAKDRRALMEYRTALGSAVLIVVGVVSAGQARSLGVQGHRSSAEIAAMTRDELVEEYCNEYARHSFLHVDYTDSLSRAISSEPATVMPAVVRIIERFDPSSRKHSGRQVDACCYAAEGMVQAFDESIVRLRGSPEGLKAVEAMERLADRMRAAHYDSARSSGEYSRRMRLEGVVSEVQSLRGINQYDQAIADTLRIKRGIKLSDDDLRRFVEYLIKKDP